MKFELDIDHNLMDQLAAQLDRYHNGSQLFFPKELGDGSITLKQFPGQIELYHFVFRLSRTVEMYSFNPDHSEWLLLNINLSKKAVKKTVNDSTINIQKFLPSGILLYTPNTKVYSKSPKGEDFEIVLVRIHKSFFSIYENEEIDTLQHSGNAIVYEDLDSKMENQLKKALEPMGNMLSMHASLLQFIGDFVAKLKNREKEHHFEHLHPNDVKGLFMAAAHLRDPLAEKIPSIKELSNIAGMGTTKFKITFKQVFGKPPMQYHQKIKFEYARQELLKKQKTASELSYELGYSHPSKFTEAYKKQFGELPSATT